MNEENSLTHDQPTEQGSPKEEVKNDAENVAKVSQPSSPNTNKNLDEVLKEKDRVNKELELKVENYAKEIEELRQKLLQLQNNSNPPTTTAVEQPIVAEDEKKSVEQSDEKPSAEQPEEKQSISIEIPITGDNNPQSLTSKSELPLTNGENLLSPTGSITSQDNATAVLFKKELDAAEFLFRRATTLHDDGWYERAQPLYDEGCIIYEKLYGKEHLQTLESTRLKAFNLYKCSKYQLSYALYNSILQSLEKISGDQSEEYLRTECDYLHLLIDIGQFAIAADRVEFIISFLNLKVENATNMNTDNKNTDLIKRFSLILGRCFCLQAIIYMTEGKLTEAKSVADRGQAVISQALGLNNVQIIYAFQTKAKVLLALAKPKEAISIMEQALMVMKGLLKAAASNNISESPNKKEKQNKKTRNSSISNTASTDSAENLIQAEKEFEHPIIAECLFIQSKALFIQCNFLEGQNKLIKVKKLFQKYYHRPDDLPLLEVEYQEAQIAMALSYYQKSLEIHHNLLPMIEKKIETMIVKPDVSNDVASPGGSGKKGLPKSPNVRKGSLRKSISTNPAENNTELFEEIDLTNHPLLAPTYHALGMLYLKLGHFTVAKEFFNKTVRQLKKFPSHLLVYDSKIQLLSIMQQQGQFAESFPYIEDATEKIRKTLPKEHLLTISLQLLLAQVYGYKKEYEDSQRLLEKSLKVMKMNYTTGHSMIPYIMIDLIQLLIRQGEAKYEEARKLLDECKMISMMIYGGVVTHEIFIQLDSIEQLLLVYEYRTLLANHEILSLTSEKKASLDGDDESLESQEKIEQREDVPKTEEEAEVTARNSIHSTGNRSTASLQKPPEVTATVTEDENDDKGDDEEEEEEEDDGLTLPSYNNEVFMNLIDSLGKVTERFSNLYQINFPSTASKVLSNNLNITTELSIPGSLLSVYMKGLLGEAKLMEFVSAQQYVGSLSTEQREMYYALQAEKAATKLGATTTSNDQKKAETANENDDNETPALSRPTVVVGSKGLEPPGKTEMENAIATLKSLVKEKDTYYLDDLEKQFRSLELQFDELEIAKYQLLRAHECKKMGMFLNADKLYDETFVLFFNCLGASNASKSIILAEILFNKAENGRFLSKNIDYIKNLHLLAIRIYRRSVAATAVAATTATTTQNKNDSHHRDTNNHEFIWKNLFALARLLVDQRLFEEVLPMHKSLHDIIITSSLSDAEREEEIHGEEDNIDVLKKHFPHIIQRMVEKKDISRLQYLIHAKIAIAKDLLHLYRFEEALKYDAEALDLLKKLSIITAIVSTSASNSHQNTPNATARGLRKSVEFATDVKPTTTITNAEQNDLLAESLIRLYCNEIQIQDYLGNFPLAEEYYQQIDGILESWKKSAATLLAASEELKDGTPGSPSSVKNKNGAPASPSHAPIPPRLPAIIQLVQSDIYLIRAEHLFLLNRCNECREFLNQSYQIRIKLFNFVKKITKNSLLLSSKKSGAKSTKEATNNAAVEGNHLLVELDWTPQKEEEMKMKFLSAIEILITSDFIKEMHQQQASKKAHQIQKNIAEHNRKEPVILTKNEKNDEKNDVEVLGKGIGDDEETLDDVESMLLSVHEIKKDFGDSKSVASSGNTSNMQDNGGEMMIESFMPKPNSDVTFEYQNTVINAHIFFIDIFHLFTRLYHLLGQSIACKETLDIALQMFYNIFPQYKISTNHTLYKLELMKNYANYQLLTNHIEESKNLHLKFLENQMSIIVSHNEIHLGLSSSLQSIAEIYLRLGQYENAMQYFNDALKIERKCFAFPRAPPVMTPTGGNISQADNNINVPSYLLHKDSHYRIQQILISCAEILTEKCFYADSNQLCDSILLQLKFYYQSIHELHFNVAKLYMLKGRNDLGLAKIELSLQFFLQSKNILTVIYDENHYQVGIIYYYCAQVMRMMGKLLETKQYLDTSIKLVRSSLGKYHYYTLLIIYEIGLNFMDLGKYNTADHVIQRAYYLLKKLLSHSGKTSTDHLIIARMMNSLGELYLKMGFLDKVNEFLENSLFICRKVMGTDRFCMIPLILANINALKCAKGVYDLALQGIESCLSMIKLIYPSIPNHYDIIQLNFVYASILYAQGRYYEAQLLYDKIYHSMKMLYPGQDHPIYYEAQYGIANCYLVLGKLDYAKALYERCLSSLKDWKGSLHPIIGNILNRLGDIYNLYYKFQLAETVLKEAWSIRCKIMKPVNENHPDIVENLLSIAENLRLRGMFDATINFKKENTSASDKKSVLTASTASFDQGDQETRKSNRPISRGDDDVVHDIIDGKTSPEKPHQANTNEKQGNDIEEMSAPTVMISTIEMLDNDQQSTDSQNINQTEEKLLEGSSKKQDASSLSQFDDPNDPNILFFDPKQYKAVPILTKATNHLMNYLNKDVNHPLYLKTRFLLAEIKKGLGKYEKALEMHEVLFQQRRKILTEAHLDTIASLTAIAELLRIMKRVFGNNPQQQKIHHTVASDPNNMIGSGPKMTGNVTLVEHLTAIALPMNQDRLASRKGGKKKSDDEFYDYGDDGAGGGENDDIYGDEVDGLLAKISMKKTLALIQSQQWKFISRPSEDPALLDSKQQKERADEKERKKQVLLKKGYMGFAFPPLKKETRPVNVDTILGGTGGGGNGSNPGNNNSNQNADPKKCLDLSISLLRKIFYPMIHSSGEDTNGNGNPTSVYDHPLLALCLYNKAEILRIKGDGMMALKLLEQSLGMRRRIFRSHHPLIADCLYAMAELLRSDQRYLQALPIYDKALEIRTETYGNNHPAIAEVQNSVGLLYMSLGNYSKAEELLNSALTICEGILGIKHPSTALIYNNHAGLLQSMGKYQEAVNVNKKTLLIKQQLYTENHPEVANTLNNLGLLYKHLKSFEKSLLYYQKALEIQQQYYSSNHPEIATTYNNIGSLLALMDGKRFEAKEYFKQSLTIRMICFGKENALVASTMNNYAGLLYSLHEYTQAKEFFEDALAIRRKIFTDENHPSIGESYHNLGYFYFMQKYYLDAKFYYEEALKIRKKCYQDQDDHIHLINTYLHLIFVYDQLKMYDLSYQCIEKVIKGKMMKYANNEKHPEIIYVNELKDAIEKKILLQKQGVKKNLKQNNVMNVNPSLISNSSSASSFVTKKKNEILGGSVPTSPVHQRAAATGSLEGDNNEIPANLSLQDHSTFDVSNVNNVNLALGEHAME